MASGGGGRFKPTSCANLSLSLSLSSESSSLSSLSLSPLSESDE